jgi:hypothetical protein
MPRFRIYDNGVSADRYTIVFCSDELADLCGGEYPYLAASGEPFHPQGFGQHGGTMSKPCDTIWENELLSTYLEFNNNGRMLYTDLSAALRTNSFLSGEKAELAKIEASKDYLAYFENVDDGSGWWVPRLGKVGHLGKRILFRNLPPNTRKFAAQAFKEYYLTPVDNDPGDGTDYCPTCDIYGFPCFCDHNKASDDD